jgi:DnaJ-class molecular chaperone
MITFRGPIELTPRHCPVCNGHGTLPDACAVHSRDGSWTYRPPSKCWQCGGSGLVLLAPLPVDHPVFTRQGEST